MHIFVTGIAGFLGSNLADYYINKNYKVSGCDNLVGGDRDFVNPKAIFYQGDCEDLDFMTRATKDVDVICHAAAYAHEGLSSISPTLICNNNVTGSVSVFTSGIRNKVKRIVYCSSMARYGNIKIPFKEDDHLKPVDPYGVSKVAAENILKILCNTHGVEYNIAVPHNIIGPKQKYDDPYRNVVSIMSNLMLQNRQPIIYGDGEQKRCFSYIDDCLDCLIPMLDQKNLNKQIINIGPDEEFVTINKVAEICTNLTGVNLKPIYKKDRPREVRHALCSSDKARKFLNYKTKTSLDEGINKTFEYIKKRGVRPFNYNIELEINNDLTPTTWKNKEI